ncbi:MAG: phospholipase D-like domain-containing protein [Gammaproteobacteria bacterium]
MNPDQIIHEVWSGLRLLPWQWILADAHVVLATLAAAHAMLYKRDSRAALGWVSVCVFFPLAGPLLYYMFGINRIQTHARRLAPVIPSRMKVGYERGTMGARPAAVMLEPDPAWQSFIRVSDRVTSRILTAGNTVEMLQNGEQAYPAMLAAIDGATRRVSLASYLFESDATGAAFVAVLASAQQRGVEVRVIVDGVGELYSRPRISRTLQRAGITVARFLPPRLLPPAFSVNLRNHRKILVVDGEQGFTGGMNIGDRHLLESASGRQTADLHFRVQGPAVGQLEAIFAEDWRFVTGQDLEPEAAQQAPAGLSFCRCISDGPNEDLDQISLVMMGAISAAQHEIIAITPYFLPSREMVACLQSAALRGVEVTIILPQRSNLRFIDWATRNLLWELLQHDVKVCYQPPPFAHTKLFVVDGVYAQVGSANLDPRSLRLNFELNLEVIGVDSVGRMIDYARSLHARSAAVTLQQVDGRALPVRLRDAACWLFMPYL